VNDRVAVKVTLNITLQARSLTHEKAPKLGAFFASAGFKFSSQETVSFSSKNS
jgi:hypothetical protein